MCAPRIILRQPLQGCPPILGCDGDRRAEERAGTDRTRNRLAVADGNSGLGTVSINGIDCGTFISVAQFISGGAHRNSAVFHRLGYLVGGWDGRGALCGASRPLLFYGGCCTLVPMATALDLR